MDRLTGRTVPYHRRLALVGDADSRDATRIDPAKNLTDDVERIAPDVLRIMLNPAGLRVMLPKLALRHRDRLRFGVEQDGACRGRALIDRQDVIGSPHALTIGCRTSPRKGFSQCLSLPIRSCHEYRFHG